jgi:hypothetical protein
MIVLGSGTIKTTGVADAIDEEAGPLPLATQGASWRDSVGMEFGSRIGPMRVGIARDAIQQRLSGENGFLDFIGKQPLHCVINLCIGFAVIRFIHGFRVV